MSRNKMYIIAFILICIMCVSGIYAFTNSTLVNVKNEINTGAVKIELNEYSKGNDGNEVLYGEVIPNVLPGQVISLIPRISNLGDSSYVRAKIGYSNSDNSTVTLTQDEIDGIDAKWVKRGDYWYYTEPLKSGENVDIFKTVTIPKNLSNDYQGKEFKLDVTAEAVQAENFKPNFDSDSPWNGIEAKKASVDNYKTDKIQTNNSSKVEYENNADSYINVPDSFFNRLGRILPGDVLIEEVTIQNKTSKEVEYFVSTDKGKELSDVETELLEKIKLNISLDNKKIYDGKLYKIDNLSLGKYTKNDLSKLIFTIEVPEDLENEYANLSATLSWKFSVKIPDDKKEEDPPKEDPKDEEPVEEPEEEKQNPPSPQTGDVKVRIAIGIFLVAAIGLIIVIIAERKLKNKEQ